MPEPTYPSAPRAELAAARRDPELPVRLGVDALADTEDLDALLCAYVDATVGLALDPQGRPLMPFVPTPPARGAAAAAARALAAAPAEALWSPAVAEVAAGLCPPAASAGRIVWWDPALCVPVTFSSRVCRDCVEAAAARDYGSWMPSLVTDGVSVAVVAGRAELWCLAVARAANLVTGPLPVSIALAMPFGLPGAIALSDRSGPCDGLHPAHR